MVPAPRSARRPRSTRRRALTIAPIAAALVAVLAQPALAAGSISSWGGNAYGQLGDGTFTGHGSATAIASLTGMVSLHGGRDHVAALKSDGTVWTWGRNQYGQIGDGTEHEPAQPHAGDGPHRGDRGRDRPLQHHGPQVRRHRLDVGLEQVRHDGDGTTTKRTRPVLVKNLTNVVAIAGGRDQMLAVKSDGTVWAWGYNAFGNLGDGTFTTRTTPVQVSGLTGAIDVAGGRDHSLVLKSDGTVWCFGYNVHGECGVGNTSNKNLPVQVSGLTGVTAITAGANHSVALKSDGTVWTWGQGSNGRLGNNSTANRSTPVQVSNLTGVVAIGTGRMHTLAAKSDGTVWAWGFNATGQLGNGNTTNQKVPVSGAGVDRRHHVRRRSGPQRRARAVGRIGRPAAPLTGPLSCAPHATVPFVHAHAPRRSGRSRDREPPPAAAGRRSCDRWLPASTRSCRWGCGRCGGSRRSSARRWTVRARSRSACRSRSRPSPGRRPAGGSSTATSSSGCRTGTDATCCSVPPRKRS